MGIADDIFGDAPQDGPSQGALAPATNHHDPYAEILAEGYDLLCRTAEPQVGFGDYAAYGPDAPACPSSSRSALRRSSAGSSSV